MSALELRKTSLERVIFHAYSRLTRQEASSGFCGFVFGALVVIFASASAASHFQFLLCTLWLQIRRESLRDYFSIKNYSPCRGDELCKFMK